MATTKNTLEKLIQKSKTLFSDKVRMPSIKQISNLLSEYDITHEVYSKTNVVEHRSKGNRYVNSRHNGKTGLCLIIKEPYIELDTSDSYYSYNTSTYAGELIKLIKNTDKYKNQNNENN